MTERTVTERETAIELLNRISSLEKQSAYNSGRFVRALKRVAELEGEVAELEAKVASLSKLAKLASPADLASLKAEIIAEYAHEQSLQRSERAKLAAGRRSPKTAVQA